MLQSGAKTNYVYSLFFVPFGNMEMILCTPVSNLRDEEDTEKPT